MRLWVTIALVALLAALLWPAGGQTRADAPPAATTSAETTTLRYETYDLTGEAATAGSYAFLSDQGTAAGVVATYEGLRDGSAERLLIHKTDAQETSRAPLYDAIASGAFFEWRKADDCWVRYRVTEVLPDPPGVAPRKLLAVEWTTYAFTGCSGAIAASTAAVIEWGPLPDLGGLSLSSPIRHGLFQLAPVGWTGQVEEDPFRPWPGNSYANPVGTTELAEARLLPHWRDPTLPSGWTLLRASSGDPSYDPPYGYCAWWANDRGYRGVEICGGFYLGRDRPRESSRSNGVIVVETRVIAGRLAIVEYSPVGPNHNSYTTVRVLVPDPIPDAVYHVRGLDWTLNGSNVDAAIAIARSLFEGANEAIAAPQGAAGQGESPAPLTGLKPLFEWWADGRPTSPPLHLELQSSRELCTAGTLTEVSWTISGGVAPYRLSIEGAAVDADADNVRVNCGALTEAEAGDAEAALATKTVTATVTDSRGVQRQAALDVARARALPAPQNISYAPELGIARTFWDWVEGAGSQSPEILAGGGNTQRDGYLVRYRAAGAGTWIYAEFRIPGRAGAWEIAGPSVHEMQVAAVRHSIEAETPAALRWSETLRYVYATAPENAAVTATATTVTVSWDAQPLAGAGSIILEGPRGVKVGRFVEPTEPGRHSYTFSDVPPETSYEVVIDKSTPTGRASGRVSMSVRTSAAPPGSAALPVGPQNVRAHATLESITVTWEAPHAGASDRYNVEVVEEATNALVDIYWINGPDRSVTLRSVFQRIRPATKYRVRVTHAGIVTSTVELVVTTPAAGQSTPLAQLKPRFEWWADGRPASPPLHLKLRSSRELCTAGTLTEVSWEISGGVAPYELSIEGAAVDVSANNVRVNCGALTEAEAGDAEAALAAKTVSAVVTDSRGVQRQAALDVARARALPAPSPRTPVGHATTIGTSWVTVDGKHHGSDVRWWLIRWRAASAPGDTDWTYRLEEHAPRHDVVLAGFGGLNQGTAYVFAAAALRDPIEQLTPDAITWSDVLKATTATTPTGVRATSTHDTITVTWDEQPSVRYVYVEFIRADGVGRYGSATMRRWDATLTDQVTLIDLEPETEYDITVSVDGDVEARLSTAIKATTAVAPTGWRAPPRGAQNLSVTATHDTITVTWDAPVPNTRDRWIVYVSHPSWTKSYARWVSAPLAVTLGPFTPETTYSVKVAHLDHHGTDVTTTVTMADAPRHGHYDQPPLIEWWADGRPTSPPLHLELASSRELCTAGTLTEVSWTISGGVAPYELSIEGEAVDLDAENVRINCGALTEAEAGDAEAALAAKTVTATVTDSRGVQRQAALEVARARALPAPQTVEYWSSVSGVVLRWGRVAGAGSQSPLTIHPVNKNRLQVSGLVRTRANSDGAAWSYHTVEKLGHSELFVEPPPHLRVFSAAAVRHPLELETPAALNWSDEVVYAATKPAQNVTLAATHDTVTVSWDRQPYAVGQQILVWLFNDAADNESWQHEHLSEDPGVTGRHTVTFTNLPPNTRLRLMIAMGDEIATRHYVRTRAAPSGWTPLPAGPRNLRHELDGDILTVLWDNPYAGAQQNWLLTIENPATGNSWLTDVYGTSWTLPGWLGVFPNTQYRVTVEHRSDMPPGSSSILITTPGPPTGQQIEVLDVSPRELWLRAFSRPGRR